MAPRPTNSALLLRIAGIGVWICAGVPALRRIFSASEKLSPISLALWMSMFLLFGILFLWTSKTFVGARIQQRTIPLLALQSIAALIMYDRVCTSFESVLLIVVAAEIGFTLMLRWGIVWIAVQSFGMLALSLAHWEDPIDSLRWTAGVFGFETFALLTAYLGASESRAKLELVRKNAELRATRELLESSIRIAERARISREIHDLLGHHLTALSLNIEIASHLAKNGAAEPLEKAKSLTKLLLCDVREAVSTMRQKEAVDLACALQCLVEGVASPAIHLEIPENLDVADPERAHALLRCVQEIVTNAIKHAGAQHLWLSVARTECAIELCARDDGRGAREVGSGHGLEIMRERLAQVGGTLAIEQAAGGGFSLKVEVPI